MNQTDSGHSILQAVFERQEMVRVAEALDEPSISRTKAGARHVLIVPVVRELAGDPRLLEIAASFLYGCCRARIRKASCPTRISNDARGT
jgi:hypothetical protein